jgi:hypothetical protein
MVNYKVFVNGYDTDGESIDLPNVLNIEVPNEMDDIEEIEDFISDEISNKTGFCHYGFTYEIESDNESEIWNILTQGLAKF